MPPPNSLSMFGPLVAFWLNEAGSGKESLGVAGVCLVLRWHGKSVAEPGYGHNVSRRPWIAFEFLAKLRDRSLKQICFLPVFRAPQRLQQPAVREGFASVTYQIPKQLELFR